MGEVFLPSGEGLAYTSIGIGMGESGRIGEHPCITGPRSCGFALPTDARWLMLVGDVTGLPAIQAIARSLPVGLKAEVYAEVEGEAEQQFIASAAELRVAWLAAQEPLGAALHQCLMYRPLPPGSDCL